MSSTRKDIIFLHNLSVPKSYRDNVDIFFFCQNNVSMTKVNYSHLYNFTSGPDMDKYAQNTSVEGEDRYE